jgi:hypothetical protein
MPPWQIADSSLRTTGAGESWVAGRAFFLILLARVPCPCLSGFWRDRAGMFVLGRLKCPSLRPGGPDDRVESYSGGCPVQAPLGRGRSPLSAACRRRPNFAKWATAPLNRRWSRPLDQAGLVPRCAQAREIPAQAELGRGTLRSRIQRNRSGAPSETLFTVLLEDLDGVQSRSSHV